jgi:hypothetical protein
LARRKSPPLRRGGIHVLAFKAATDMSKRGCDYAVLMRVVEGELPNGTCEQNAKHIENGKQVIENLPVETDATHFEIMSTNIQQWLTKHQRASASAITKSEQERERVGFDEKGYNELMLH